MLALVLIAMHMQEDQLRAALGIKHRTSRPEVSASAVAMAYVLGAVLDSALLALSRQ